MPTAQCAWQSTSRFWRARDGWRGDLSRYPYELEQAAPAIVLSVRAMNAAIRDRLGFVQRGYVRWVFGMLR
jgi:hypothetical protein